MMKQAHSGIISHSGPGWTIVCDFDGTISCADVTDTLMANFGHADWEILEQRWEKGEIGSRECMSGQIALLDMNKQELDACLDTIEIDPAFGAFSRWAAAQAIPLYVVSDGLDYAIDRILLNNGLAGLPIIANHLEQVSERRWSVSFPYYNAHCRQASGTCKCQVARELNPEAFIAIGDGRSDFCVASTADHVLAKESLLKECLRSGIAHTAFSSFSEARACMKTLLTETTALPTESL